MRTAAFGRKKVTAIRRKSFLNYKKLVHYHVEFASAVQLRNPLLLHAAKVKKVWVSAILRA